MLVNSALTGLFTWRSVARPVITSLVLGIFWVSSSFARHTDPNLRAKQVNLMIRQIGHQLLLKSGDLTSRVLPVTESKDGTFLLRFEKELFFDHDSLLILSRALLPKAQFPGGYTVTVHDCKEGSIVYGFQVSNTSPDILACSGRSQPAGCYTIEYTFPDFYGNEEQKKAGIGHLSKAVKNGLRDVRPEGETLQTASLDPDIDQLPATNVAKDIHAQPASEITSFDYLSIPAIVGGLLVLLLIILLIGRFGKTVKPTAVNDQAYVTTTEPLSELPALGKFLFNVKGQRLLLGNEVISLTDKECQVLELLHKNFGELIPRDTLMQEIWINEGVITGRSLDMFVSKLRKKLSHDPELSITNVHGKGYKLEVVERETEESPE